MMDLFHSFTRMKILKFIVALLSFDKRLKIITNSFRILINIRKSSQEW